MPNDIARLDTLLALAFLHHREPKSCLPINAANQDQSEIKQLKVNQVAEARALVSLSELSAADQRLLEGRAAWYAKLTQEEQTRWLSIVLARARTTLSQRSLDEHIHPSHIVEALRSEMPSTKRLVLQYLPRAFAEQVALDLEPQYGGKDSLLFDVERLAVRRLDAKGVALDKAFAKDVDPLNLSINSCPNEDVVAIVREAFLAKFVTKKMLPETTPLDLLSSVELSRLIRIVGGREIAVACQGTTAVEAVTAFLRRFSPADMRLIVKHLETITDVSGERIDLAERLVGKTCDATTDVDLVPNQIINCVGLSLLATAVARRPRVIVDYTRQKLPVSVATKFHELINEAQNSPDDATLNIITAEIERLAATMRRTS